MVSTNRDFRDARQLVATIANAIAVDPPIALVDGGVIRKGYNAELDEIRSIAFGAKDWIAKLQQKEKARTGIPSLKISFNNVFGYYIEITNTHKEKVPGDYIRKQTLANAERYITPDLKEYEEKVLHAEEKILEEEKEIIEEEKELEEENPKDAPMEREAQEAVKEEEEKELEKERMGKEKELEEAEKSKEPRLEIVDEKVSRMVENTKKFAEGRQETANDILKEIKHQELKGIKTQEKKENARQKEQGAPSAHELKAQKEKKSQEEVEKLARELVRKGTLRK